ncbi:MAG: hypothetical protein K2I96_15710 [Lachnospiraceae bacterium]|nr:hypothetical protein [Lachnospiraceae bacterium]
MFQTDPAFDDMLLVPMKIEGLMVGKDGGEVTYGDASVNFRLLKHTMLGEQMQAVPLSQGKPLETGIHLHWILPDNFTHGVSLAETDAVSYPHVPDRWRVTRIVTRQGNTRETVVDSKSFLVESNAISRRPTEENQGSSTFPVRNAGALDYTYLGRSGEYGKLSEWKEYLPELTAVGYGEPTYSAYYCGCRNVFGFYDSLEGVADGRITYQVSGWFSNPDQDPLAQVDSEEAFQKKLTELYWRVEKGTAKEKVSEEERDFCNRTLCHGTLCGLEWAGQKQIYSTGIPSENPKIAIGNSSNEAFAALIASRKEAEAADERIADIFLSAQMEQWTKPDGIIASEQKLHEKTFDDLYADQVWMLKRRPENRDDKEVWELGGELAEALDRLNQQQRAAYRLEEELLDKEKNLYGLWYKYAADKNRDTAFKKDCLGQMRQEAAVIQILFRQIQEQNQEIDSLKDSILKQPVKSGSSVHTVDKFKLVSCPEEHYFMPGEPVILLAGAGMENSYNNSRDMGLSQDGKQLCRRRNQLIQQFSIERDVYGTRKEIEICSDFLLKYITNRNEFPHIIRELLQETLLLSIDLAGVIAEHVLQFCGQPVMDDMFQELQDEIMQKQQEPYDALLHSGEDVQNRARTLNFQGIFPSKAAFQYYVPPWNPLYIEWAIDYTPDSDVIDGKKKRLGKWELEDMDYHLTKELGYYRKSTRYKGRMLITPHFMDEFKELIENYRKLSGENNAAVWEKLNRLQEIDVMSQRLNGFHENFLMEHLVLKLPIADLWQQDADMRNVFADFSEEQRKKCFEQIEDQVLTNPFIEGIFSPIRAGYGVMTQLRLIDTFGRVKSICDESNYEMQAREIACSEHFREKAKDDKRIIFSPRLMQPAKISAHFLSAGNKNIITNEALCTSPIIGWFVPNYLDGSLMVLDQDGRPLGNFMTAVDRQQHYDVIWMNVPGDREVVGEEKRYTLPQGVKGELSTCLREFYAAMTNEIGSNHMVLYDFVNYLCNEICGMNKPNGTWKKDMLHFVGRPLALVQAEFALETRHKLSRPQSWKAAQEQADDSLWDMDFTVRLGEGRKSGDGLAGFFKQGEQTYHRFYTYDRDRIDRKGFIVQSNEIMLNCTRKAADNRYTLLMDPTLPIHIISGILPVKKMQISPEMVSASLGKLKLEIPVFPLLTDLQQVQAPFMQIPERTWSWVGVRDGRYVEEALEKQPSEVAFETVYPIRMTEGFIRLSDGSR